MRYRLQAAPWWALSLMMGTFFGVFMAIVGRLNDPEAYGGSPVGLILNALVTGVPFGLIMGPVTARTNRRAATAAEVDDPHEMIAVSRAATRGPVPTDPQVRVAARKLAHHRLDELRRKRIFTLSVFGLGTLGYVAGAIFSSHWWALAAVLFAGLLAYSLILPGRLQRRISLLSEPARSAPNHTPDQS